MPIDSDIPSILLIGQGFSGGGAERRFYYIATHLFSGNIDVAVLSKDQDIESVRAKEIFELGWKSRLSYPKAVWRLTRLMYREEYAVAMAFGLFPNVILVLANLLSGRRSRVVVSEITRPKLAAKSLRGLIYTLLRRVLYKRSSLITANSIDGLRETCELANIPMERGVRVVNVLDPLRLAALNRDGLTIALPKKKFIVCITRLIFMKRIDSVINAVNLLKGKIECCLVIVGDGEAKLALESQVHSLGLQDVVTFAGRIDNPYPVLSRASALVLASEYEGFSNSVLEAMFFDIPVITSFCSSDAREMCEKGAALGFEVGDSKALAGHIEAVIEHENIQKSLVDQARRIRTTHALDQAIPFYEALLRKVASGKTAG